MARILLTGSRAVLAALALAVASCSTFVGALDDGKPEPPSPPPPAPLAPAVQASLRHSRCASWLEGYPTRIRYAVEAAPHAIDGYQAGFVLDAQSLVASGLMRADGADLRVTSADGVTEVPHFLEPAGDPHETMVWTKLDVAAGTTRFFVYTGKRDAVDDSSIETTFANVLPTDDFGRSDLWEQASGATALDQWSITFGAASATLHIERPPSTNDAQVMICQDTLFPDGSTYAYDFVVDLSLSAFGASDAWTDADDAAFWHSDQTGTQLVRLPYSSHTPRIRPGMHQLCFGVGAVHGTAGQAATATFSSVRVRRTFDPELPPALPIGPVERCTD
jgi:hypothetical protein